MPVRAVGQGCVYLSAAGCPLPKTQRSQDPERPMYETVTAADLRRCMSHHLMRVQVGRVRLLITRNNRDFAALVQVRDLDALERAEKTCAELHWTNQQRAFTEFLALKKTLHRDVEARLSRRPVVPPEKTG